VCCGWLHESALLSTLTNTFAKFRLKVLSTIQHDYTANISLPDKKSWREKKITAGPTQKGESSRPVDKLRSCIQDSVDAIIFKLPTQIAASCRHVSS